MWHFGLILSKTRALNSPEDTVNLQSRRQRPLGRYFPEIIQATRHLPVQRFVFDGELIIPDEPFNTLQLRLHPAESRGPATVA